MPHFNPPVKLQLAFAAARAAVSFRCIPVIAHARQIHISLRIQIPVMVIRFIGTCNACLHAGDFTIDQYRQRKAIRPDKADRNAR
ncbi:hypothetical protein D3C84_889650 [compost metagenome]